VRRLTWPEMVDYWDAHARRFGDLDYERDPGGLANVCGPGQPLWLSRHLARSQLRVFEELVSALPRPAPDATALDVGTGAARWARLLAEAGYRTTGIDLQHNLIEDDRRRFPGIEFHEVALQEYEPEGEFDVVCSVTVLQHIPFEEQVVCIRRLREMTKTGGRALVLEHIVDQSPHVFSRTAEGWQAVFEDAGFECLAMRRYNYNPALRSYSALRKHVKRPDWTRRSDADLRPEHLVAQKAEPAESGRRRILRFGDRALMRLAVTADRGLEPYLVSRQSSIRAPADCGFLFSAR
jgi:trans-aconitate methyltransferase